jgi:phage protein D/phage baseplate assembly protein gpV
MPDKVTQFHIEVDGQTLPPAYALHLHSLTVESSLNLPSIAEFSLVDNKIEFIDGQLLLPGKSLKIHSRGSDGADQTLFDGEIVELEPHFDYPNAYCVVRAFDRLHRLMRGTYARDFYDFFDSDLAKKIAGEAELKFADTSKTSPKHDYIFQDNETNLKFLQRRASALGYVVFAKGEELHFEAPGFSSEVELRWGKDGLSSFRPRLTTLGQPTEITVLGWDYRTKKTVRGPAGVGTGQPKIGESTDRVAMTQKFKKATTSLLISSTARSDDQAKILANAEANKRSGEYVQAEGICGGHPGVIAGAKLKITNIGDRFKGDYIVTNAIHSYNASKTYQTQFTVAAMHTQSLMGILAPDHPPHYGLEIGIVKTINDEKGDFGRVKVSYPSLGDKDSEWARVVSVGGGSTRGIEFLPEVGDEVLIGFEQGDIHAPYVLGGLWNGEDTPPGKKSWIVGGQAGNQVLRRVIRSRTGHLVTLDDSRESPGVTVEDSKGNKIHIDTKAGTMTLEAKTAINIKSEKVTINGSTLVEIDGKAIKIG